MGVQPLHLLGTLPTMSEHACHDHWHQHDAPRIAFDPHSVEHWDERYSGEQVWSGNPNQALVDEVSGLAPGRALDVGCGEGADAVWLARRGWQVTALDISSNAVERTLAAAGDLPVTGVVGSFSDATVEGPFDLVSCMFPVIPLAGGMAWPKLSGLVAPGGALVFVHHVLDPEQQRSHGFDPDEFLSTEQVVSVLAADEGWRIETDEERQRSVTEGRGAGHTCDHVVRATRLS